MGNYANSWGEISHVLMGVLVISRGVGGLTREFWAVFEETILSCADGENWD
jgi:hypothetical protein